MTDHRKAYLAELSKLLTPGPNQPHVVYDQPMPPYRYQRLDYGGGWATSGGVSGFYPDPRRKP